MTYVLHYCDYDFAMREGYHGHFMHSLDATSLEEAEAEAKQFLAKELFVRANFEWFLGERKTATRLFDTRRLDDVA